MATKKTNLTEEEVIEQAKAKMSEEVEYLFPEGPTMNQIDQWKEEYGQIYMTEVTEEDIFLWRILSRKEFKDIMKLGEADALYREEKVCEKCILWPEEYSFEEITNGKAGAPTVLAEQIMEKSGFNPRTGPVAL